MNTIYDGTFVIGDTTTTTFEAGPGISITEPSAGTLKIGSDETVLWSGTPQNSGTVQLSESIGNFDRVLFYFTKLNDFETNKKSGPFCDFCRLILSEFK